MGAPPFGFGKGRSITITHSYDALSRLTGKTYSNGDAAVSYFYDQTSYNGLTIAKGIGRRTGMSDASGATAWSYDEDGGVLTERRTISGITKTISYTYNLDGSLATLTYPSGRVITYSYNAAARLTSGVDVANSINYATGASYAPHGALASLTNGASLVSTYYYNSRLQPCRISVKSSGVGAKRVPFSVTQRFTVKGNWVPVFQRVEGNMYVGRWSQFVQVSKQAIDISNDPLDKITLAAKK